VTATTFLTALPSLLMGLAAILLVVAACCDLLTRLIPNSIPAALAVIGLVLRVVDGSWAWSLLAFAIVLAVTVFCWLRGWMGGGDVKLLAACALLVPPGSVFPMITMVGIAGGVLALVYLVARRVVPRPLPRGPGQRPTGYIARALRAEHWRLSRGAALPYAVAIAIGGLISFT